MTSDTPRYLARRSEIGYVPNRAAALAGELEAVPADVQDDLTIRAARRIRQGQLDTWRETRVRLERELDVLYDQRFGRDVTKQLRALQRQIDQIDARLHT